MSDTQERRSTSGSRINEAPGHETFQETTGWGGMVIFGATMLIMLGTFQAIAGLVAIFDSGYYLVGKGGLVVEIDYTAWGWLHLIVGVLAFAAGFGLFAGATWARLVGIAIALVSAVANFAFIPAYPIWSIAIITVDVLVIYAIAAHGREVTSYKD